MKAIVQTSVGEPAEVLKLVDLETPQPGPGEVVIDVALASVHHGDVLQTRSTSTIPEPVGHIRRGSEAVGVIRSLSADVAREGHPKVGDRVIGFPAAGSWAESVAIPATAAIPVPPNIADEVAAQLFVNYTTARMVLRGLRKSVSEEVLRQGAVIVTGAGTVVARLLLHFLDKEGIKPIGLARSAVTAKRVATELAGVQVTSVDDADWRAQVTSFAAGRKIVGVLDCVAGPLIADLLPLVANETAIVSYGALGGSELTLGPVELVSRQLVASGVIFGKWFRELSSEERADDIQAAFRLAAELPALFRVSSIHSLADIKQAVLAVEAPGRDGFVFVKPVGSDELAMTGPAPRQPLGRT